MKKLLETLESKREITAEDIIEARLSGDQNALNEASLGRVYQHVKKAGEKGSLGILTAFLDDPPGAGGDKVKAKKINLENQKKLKATIKSSGLGFFKLRGHWDEVQDDGSTVNVSEPSIAVPGISRELIVKLRRKYHQNAVVYLGPETKGEATLIYADKVEKIGKFSANRIAAAYSKVKGRPFMFEWITQSWGEAMIEQTMLRKRGLAEPSRSV